MFAIITLFCFIGLFFTGALLQLLTRHRKKVADELLHSSQPLLFWKLYRTLCKDDRTESFAFCTTCAQFLLGTFYIIFFLATIVETTSLAHYLTTTAWMNLFEILKLLFFLSILIGSYTISADFLPRTWALYSPTSLVRCTTKPADLFLIVLSPILLLVCRLIKRIAPHAGFSAFSEPKEQFIELFGDREVNEHDKRLLHSILHFKDRIVREIMKPRVDLFCIPEEMTLHEASELLQSESYSRVPIYRGTIDTIVGILFYKDVLSRYMKAAENSPNKAQLLSTPVKHFMKKVFYCPETKKISSLLQEFRKRHSHLAIIVDEYGGTAGLVTIEDILEEIVGEISDEFDDQEILFRPTPGGGWIVDAKMNLLDIEEDLGIKIPQEGDYDTLAGYIFYRVGSIPPEGLILHHDQFEIEILKSHDRMVEEVTIHPIIEEEQKESSSEEPST